MHFQVFPLKMSHVEFLRSGELSKLRPIEGSKLLPESSPQSVNSIIDPITILLDGECMKVVENINGFQDFEYLDLDEKIEPLVLLSLYIASSRDGSTQLNGLVAQFSKTGIWNCFRDGNLTIRPTGNSNLEWTGPIILELEKIRTRHLLSLESVSNEDLSNILPLCYSFLVEWHGILQEVTSLNIEVLSKFSNLLGKSWFTPKLVNVISYYIKRNAMLTEMISLLSVHAELGEPEVPELLEILMKNTNLSLDLTNQLAFTICSYFTSKCTIFQVLKFREWFPRQLKIGYINEIT